ncbi:mitotic checkpoint protein BUB3.3-like [Arachis ipaensis]|uniref:Uncharacterized protein n=1 Tax=Arachis hypogaea TaxID=3818 RepID=A0A445CW21_ARAHY|nr:mitotic checkpoint protein BUB3.3-like [Arachis ipaensis]XP_025659718.1 mitotic checkpoint protein BUB3.3-like [Arachis hypogaea]QHN89049.1 Mitotic checkpoint protein [Arachis hypogaea]RYR55135.1 hypothetical protein Ahy_A06g030386 isoform B [Arachis hypogaea]
MKGDNSDSLLLKLEAPTRDAISRVRFAPHFNNLLISSWDSSLRLYDVDASLLRLEAPSEAPLLDCYFHDEAVAFSAASDGLIRRYDLDSGIIDTMGGHDDIASCIGYSSETCKLLTKSLMPFYSCNLHLLIFHLLIMLGISATN